MISQGNSIYHCSRSHTERIKCTKNQLKPVQLYDACGVLAIILEPFPGQTSQARVQFIRVELELVVRPPSENYHTFRKPIDFERARGDQYLTTSEQPGGLELILRSTNCTIVSTSDLGSLC